jgi:hypothetical protein
VKFSQPFSICSLNLIGCNLAPKILLQFIKSLMRLKELMINYLAFDCNKCYWAISRMPSIKVLRIYSVYCVSAFLDSIVNYLKLETAEVSDNLIYFKRLIENFVDLAKRNSSKSLTTNSTLTESLIKTIPKNMRIVPKKYYIKEI